LILEIFSPTNSYVSVRLLYQKNNKISSCFAWAKENSTYEKSSFINYSLKSLWEEQQLRAFFILLFF